MVLAHSWADDLWLKDPIIGGAVDAERREHYRAREMNRYCRDRYIDDRDYYRDSRRYRGSRTVRRAEIIEYD